MEIQHALALAVFASYFLAIIGLFVLIAKNLSALHTSQKQPRQLKTLVFITLTGLSLAHTWYYMFAYMKWSFERYEQSLTPPINYEVLERVSSWLQNTSLFEEAWVLVCSKPINWWWSEQLCLFTAGTWTIFLAVEGKRHNVKYTWAYMVLGQIVAISVAANLFYLALILSPPPPHTNNSSKVRVGPILWLTVLLSLGTVALSPSTSTRTFLPNLLVMHALLIVPLLSKRAVVTATTIPPFSMSVGNLYRVICVAAALIHVCTVITAIESLSHQTSVPVSQASLKLVTTAWQILHQHPAQSSIGWDVVWTSLSFVVWIASRPSVTSDLRKSISIGYLVLATPAACIGVTAPYILQPRDEEEPVNLKRG